MTERERWIIYPLLFLALGASMRDKFTRPVQFEATKLDCEELRAQRVVIVDPQQKRPRLKFGTATETAAQASGAAPNVSGQIEVLDNSQRVQTAIVGGLVQTHALLSSGMVVVDPLGRTRVEIGTKVENPGDAKQPPRTHGGLEIISNENVPAVILSSTSEGGVVVARHARVPMAVVVGNIERGSGTFLQLKDRPIPLIQPISVQEIKLLEAQQKEQAKQPEGSKKTVPATQGTKP